MGKRPPPIHTRLPLCPSLLLLPPPLPYSLARQLQFSGPPPFAPQSPRLGGVKKTGAHCGCQPSPRACVWYVDKSSVGPANSFALRLLFVPIP